MQLYFCLTFLPWLRSCWQAVQPLPMMHPVILASYSGNFLSEIPHDGKCFSYPINRSLIFNKSEVSMGLFDLLTGHFQKPKQYCALCGGCDSYRYEMEKWRDSMVIHCRAADIYGIPCRYEPQGEDGCANFKPLGSQRFW